MMKASISQNTSRLSIIWLIATTVAVFTVQSTHSYFTETIASTERRLDEDEVVMERNENKTNSFGARPFNVWDRSEIPFPCVPEENPDTEGIFYIKVPKTSSSTLGKITSRIAGREAKRQGFEEGKICKVYDPYILHQTAYNLNCGKRDKSKSFLWSVIRYPPSRAISHYGMRIHQGIVVNNNDTTFIKDLETSNEYSPNKQLGYLIPDYDLSTLKGREDYPALVASVMDEFNFIGTYERLYESLVILSFLMQGSLSDVLFDYLPSIYSRCGSYEDPEWLTSGMKNYVESPKWKEREEGDFLLYQVVNESLDLTIEKIGRDLVRQELEKFERLISIGSEIGPSLINKKGCGIPGIHPNLQPFADIDELPWFWRLSPQDQQLVRDCK